ncbi:MAG: hypothetical protein ABIA76_01115 [Candidatus Diapherotrites archaeon]
MRSPGMRAMKNIQNAAAKGWQTRANNIEPKTPEQPTTSDPKNRQRAKIPTQKEEKK